MVAIVRESSTARTSAEAAKQPFAGPDMNPTEYNMMWVGQYPGAERMSIDGSGGGGGVGGGPGDSMLSVGMSVLDGDHSQHSMDMSTLIMTEYADASGQMMMAPEMYAEQPMDAYQTIIGVSGEGEMVLHEHDSLDGDCDDDAASEQTPAMQMLPLTGPLPMQYMMQQAPQHDAVVIQRMILDADEAPGQADLLVDAHGNILVDAQLLIDQAAIQAQQQHLQQQQQQQFTAGNVLVMDGMAMLDAPAIVREAQNGPRPRQSKSRKQAADKARLNGGYVGEQGAIVRSDDTGDLEAATASMHINHSRSNGGKKLPKAPRPSKKDHTTKHVAIRPHPSNTPPPPSPDLGSDADGQLFGQPISNKKIKPVRRPGLVLKTPIAYQPCIDPSVIPIQRDGMAVCERCGAIGVKHSFYTKERRFCSMSCTRNETDAVAYVPDEPGQPEQAPTKTRKPVGAAAGADDGPSEADQIDADRLAMPPPPRPLRRSATSSLVFPAPDTPPPAHRPDVKPVAPTLIRRCFRRSRHWTSVRRRREPEKDVNYTIDHDAMLQDTADQADFVINHAELRQQLLAQKTLPYRYVFASQVLPIQVKSEPGEGGDPNAADNQPGDHPLRPLHGHHYEWPDRTLGRRCFRAVSVSCLFDAPAAEMWHFIRRGVCVEVESMKDDAPAASPSDPPVVPQTFWIGRIRRVVGYKALIRYEGCTKHDGRDFWVSLCGSEVHHVGWCAERGKTLEPPAFLAARLATTAGATDALLRRTLADCRSFPRRFYRNVRRSMQSRFRCGMQLEVVDWLHHSQVKLATVQRIIGKRLLIRYYDSKVDSDFWCHEDSPLIHPVGWASTVGHRLNAPLEYLERMAGNADQPIEPHEDDATISHFRLDFAFENYPNGDGGGFCVGMLLEVIDPLDAGSICAAVVAKVLKFGYFMVSVLAHRDPEPRDWFCFHERSTSVFPVGFCQRNGVALCPPFGCDADTFDWPEYLRTNEALRAADEALFHRPESPFAPGFEDGMRLECFDMMDPRVVCVGIVRRVVGRLLLIGLHVYGNECAQWMDCESPELQTVGWCALVGFKLQGPEKPPKVRKPKKATTKKPCREFAAAEKTSDEEIEAAAKAAFQADAFPDDSETDEARSRDSVDFETLVTSKAEPFEPTELPPDLIMTESCESAHGPDESGKAEVNGMMIDCVDKFSPADGKERQPDKCAVLLENGIERIKEPQRVSAPDAQPSNNGQAVPCGPHQWSVEDVTQFLRANDCGAHANTFAESRIDGHRMLSLTKDDIVALLRHKVGPALKILDLIQQLKSKPGHRLTTGRT